MSAAAASRVLPSLPVREVAGIWLRHLTSLLLPGNALLFLWTGPHPWYVAPLFLIPIGFAYYLDDGERVERRQPSPALPAWPFDALVYALAGLQLWTIYELARLFSSQAFFSVDMLLVFVIVGASSGFSIITAHELIHRKTRFEQTLGRLLLCTVLNEHFYTEHLRGHHVKVGTPDDPATARYGERYQDFYWRTIRGQFASAWRIEQRRLGDPDALDVRMFKNRILHGLVVGWGLAFAILAWAGPVAFAAFLLQAWSASRLLEAVNYFEHWGLTRRGHRVGPEDSWDTHAWFTYYGLTGLSRHADHHAEPARPFQQLRVFEQAPMLPAGYVRMVDLVMGKNDEFRQGATEELERRGLGPFADAADVEAVRAVGVATPSVQPGRLRSFWQSWPLPVRQGLVAIALLVAVTAGGIWEYGTASSFGGLFAWNGYIAAAFAAMIATHAGLARRVSSDGVCWAAAFVVLIAVGKLGETFVA